MWYLTRDREWNALYLYTFLNKAPLQKVTGRVNKLSMMYVLGIFDTDGGWSW